MTIVCGIDAHDKELVCRIWRSDQVEETKRARNTEAGRDGLWRHLARLREELEGERVIVGYEACGLGYTIHDEAIDQGFTCFVLATIKMAKSPMDGKRKTDEYDANKLCELLRAHVLAGLALPRVWVPDRQLRDDRESVRRRFDVKKGSTQVKNQIHGLLKRHGIKRPEGAGGLWTKPFMGWLKTLELPQGARVHLDSLIQEHNAFVENVKALDRELERLAGTERYLMQAEALTAIRGVGTLTAMVFLTELGDLDRFPNRRTVKSYVGLAPTSHESGEITDRKGHIARSGSSRLRAVLNQATWSRLGCDAEEGAWFENYVSHHTGGKKKAAVICMGRLLRLMWHLALEAQHATQRLTA